MVPLFDLHCDTLGKMYIEGCSIASSPLHISLDKCKEILPYAQVMAIWSDCRLSPDEAYEIYKNTVSYAREQGIEFTKSGEKIGERSFILAVEDAKILNGDISRLNTLHNDGVKILTLCWSDTSCIGGGWNTDAPLTPFGVQVVKRCFELGIIPDVSHASLSVADKTIRIAKEYNKTIIASHSNSYTVCRNDRNLRDEDFIKIRDLGGIVGISLCPSHLAKDGKADINKIIDHIAHYISFGGENTVCLGCDFDGVSGLPEGIDNISSLPRLYRKIRERLGGETADRVFFQNAYEYFKNNC